MGVVEPLLPLTVMNEWIGEQIKSEKYISWSFLWIDGTPRANEIVFLIYYVFPLLFPSDIAPSFCFSRRIPKELIPVHALIYCVGPLFVAKTAVTCQTVDLTRALRACCGIWHRGVSSSSFKTCQLQVGPPRPGTRLLSTSHRCQFDWDLGNLEAKSTPQTR